MKHSSIHIDDLKLDYLIWGTGPTVLLALHGYGLDGSCFQQLEFLGDKYTVHSIHLPYHSTSEWNGTSPLPPELWHRFVDEWKHRHHIDRYDVMAFSMGGKFGLSVLDHDAPHIDKLILIAPDGVNRNFWYRIATGSTFTRWLFKFLAGEKGYFFTFSNFLGKLNLVPKISVKFAQSQMRTAEDRVRGYKVWTMFRLIHTPLATRLKTIVVNNIHVKLFTGKHDKVILKKDVEGLNVLPKELFDWQELDCGHTHILRHVRW